MKTEFEHKFNIGDVVYTLEYPVDRCLPYRLYISERSVKSIRYIIEKYRSYVMYLLEPYSNNFENKWLYEDGDKSGFIDETLCVYGNWQEAREALTKYQDD